MIARVVTSARRRVPRSLGVLSPAVVAASAMLACAVVLADAPTAVRAAVVVWFTLVGPGGAVVPLLGLSDRTAEITLCLAVSLALDLAVACALVYTGAWSPAAGIVVLAAFTLAGAGHRACRPDSGNRHGGVRRVHVDGAGRRTGVYRLAAGACAQDAMRRAGSARPGASVNGIDLAAKVTVGRRIAPARGAAAAAGAAGATATAEAPADARGTRISLNSATAEQLYTLDGVGPATARRIIDWRAQHGGFRSFADLGQVPGIGPKKLAELRNKVQP